MIDKLLLVIFLAFTVSSFSQTQGDEVHVTKFTKPAISVGLLVNDLAASKRFYVDILGLVETRKFSIDQSFGQQSGLSEGTPFDVTIVKPEGGELSTQIKLVEFKEKLPEANQGAIQQTAGVRYLTFFIDDVPEVLERIRKAGIPLEGSCPLSLGNGADFVVIRDPDGVFVELIGPPK